MVMMTAEGISQFVTGEPFVKLQTAHHTQVAQELDRPVNGHAVDRTVVEVSMDLFDAQRFLCRQEDARNGPSRLGQTVTSFLEQGIYAVRRNGHSHMIP